MPETIHLEGMNEAQRKAVLHGEGPLLLLAGPGSGKTFTITNRILYLLTQGVPPESVLVITFMKEAALSMQERFRKICAGSPAGAAYPYGSGSGHCSDSGPNPRSGAHAASYPVNFGTFHSVFYHILKESHALYSDQILTASEKKNLLIPILKKYGKRKGQESGQSSREELGEEALQILSAIGYYKNTMKLQEAAGKAPAEWQQVFKDICQEYEGAVKKAGRLDFDDMLWDCRKLLKENLKAREYWQKRFRHILIDEFQDINPVQYETVKLLTEKPYNIFAVGDDDQAIYGFRGSEPECLKRFAEEFHARQLLLDVNYRSRPEIVEVSLKVIGANKDRFVKELKAAGRQEDAAVSENGGMAGRRNASAFSLHTFKDSEEQYGHMLRELAVQCGGPDSCAVLFRTNSYMQGFAARLKAADIPYEMRERAVSIYEHFIVRDIMAYLQVAKGEGTREQMLRIMNRPSRYICREAAEEGRADIRNMIRYYREAPLPRRQKEDVLERLSLFERQLSGIGRLSLLPAVSYILKAAGYERYLREVSKGKPEKWAQWQELLEWLKGDAAKHRELRAWMDFQEEYGETVTQGTAKVQGRKDSIIKEMPAQQEIPAGAGKPAGDAAAAIINPIQLLTVHGAKGLEFDNVWIPDCNEGVFPHGRMPDEKTVEEERRIFYVAMTRAKKSLRLLCLAGTEERPRLPSRFLNPV